MIMPATNIIAMPQATPQAMDTSNLIAEVYVSTIPFLGKLMV
jgi:hypothetical protein